jgi:hypothetical protein
VSTSLHRLEVWLTGLKTEHVIKSGLLGQEFDKYQNDIRTAQDEVRQCTALVDKNGQYEYYRVVLVYL